MGCFSYRDREPVRHGAVRSAETSGIEAVAHANPVAVRTDLPAERCTRRAVLRRGHVSYVGRPALPEHRSRSFVSIEPFLGRDPR